MKNVSIQYIQAVKAITVTFLVRENTARKELHPLELTSKVTTEFAYNGTSKGLYKCCGQKRNSELQHVSFLVDSPKLKNVCLLRDRLDHTDDFDAFELLGQHIRKESTDGSSLHTSLVRSVPSANLLQFCHIESPFNRTSREEEGGNLTETQL